MGCVGLGQEYSNVGGSVWVELTVEVMMVGLGYVNWTMTMSGIRWLEYRK